MKKLIAALALATVATVASPVAAAAAPGEASIPFVQYGAVDNWTAKDDSTLYVQSTRGKWYEVDLAIPCAGLPSAVRIGFDTGIGDTLDAFSNVIVDGQLCPVRGITALGSAPQQTGSKD